MNVSEKIVQQELQLSALRREQLCLADQYDALKAEFRSLIDKFNIQTQERKKKDADISARIAQLELELEALKRGLQTDAVYEENVHQKVAEETSAVPESASEPKPTSFQPTAEDEPGQSASQEPERASSGFDLEKFVGENLISKLGILILLVGVAIGGRYAIANNLISLAVRIALGFVVAFVIKASPTSIRKTTIRLVQCSAAAVWPSCTS